MSLVVFVVAFFAAAYLPIGSVLLRRLEAHYPPVTDIGEVVGIVVLSGGSAANKAYSEDRPVCVPEERLQVAIELALSHPNAILLYSGRTEPLFGAKPAQVILDAGISSDRFIVDALSKTTAENAANAAKAAGEAVEDPWILVTSAYHMKRSIAAFRRAGWRKLIPCPVIHGPEFGRRTARANLAALNIAIKQYVGLVGYYLTGRA